MIKAIETVYNGYRFRSRLEARWAVFFDNAGIPYEYEPEGFELSDGTYYLPDFYLPWFECYVEIKPQNISTFDKGEAERKCCRLFDDGENIITMLCIGDPVDWDVTVFCNDANDSGGGGPMGWEAWFIPSQKWNKFTFPVSMCASGFRNDRTFFTSSWQYAEIINADDCADAYRYKDYFDSAKLKARQARFEHGETPQNETNSNKKISPYHYDKILIQED